MDIIETMVRSVESGDESGDERGDRPKMWVDQDLRTGDGLHDTTASDVRFGQDDDPSQVNGPAKGFGTEKLVEDISNPDGYASPGLGMLARLSTRLR